VTAPKHRLVVVGNGMAGARFVEDLLARRGGDRFDIVVFGAEPCGNYNRVLLSGMLAGTQRAEDIIINSIEWYAAHGVTLHAGARVERIDLGARVLRAANGVLQPYDALVMATGSRPVLPPIDGLLVEEGRLRPGVHAFRTVADCDAILADARQARRAVVIGGGLLGLEAARGLLHQGIEVDVVHLASHVMETQLDAEGGRILLRQLERMGLRVWVGRTTTAVLGHAGVEGLAFGDGSRLACDLVVVAAGITPNTDLARACGLAVRRGIVVGDDLACAGVPDTYAIGECAEHRGQVYGLVAPVWDQARALADRLSGHDVSAVYTGSRLSTKLKVAGVDVAVMGVREPLEEDDEVISYAEPSRGIYKKLIVRDNRLVGAMLIGADTVAPALAQAFADQSVLTDARSDLLFPIPTETPALAAEAIPDSARICDCNGVTKAQIVDAVLGGARSVNAVCSRTRASTGCGSCRPEVERIVELACRGAERPELLERPPAGPGPAPSPAGIVVTLNKIERIKKEKDGLDVLPEVPALAAGPWTAVEEGDRERLKWAGVFFRRQTPGKLMMRLRLPNGFATAEQVRQMGDLSEEFGTGSVDVTTRQQIQLRGFDLAHVPEIWSRLERVGLGSLQTGMDNVRNVIGCPVAGLSPRELLDASPVVREFTEAFLRNKAFTNLPRKFNVGISGCTEHCTHAESQDLALTPAVTHRDGRKVPGFNVAVGGKMGSGGCRMATPLDVFVEREEAASLCAEVTLIFRDHGSRAARNRARLSFLLESWGAERFRTELASRLGRRLERAGKDARVARGADHLGVHEQKQAGLSYVGLLVPVGRMAARQLRALADLANEHGSGDIRFTTSQNVIVPNVPDARLPGLLADPLLTELPFDPHGAMRSVVACTGIDYCHFALIETKEIAVKTARELAAVLPRDRRFSMHWSGCPAGCGNHAAADIGLLGKNIRVDGQIVEAVDVFVGGRAGPNAVAGSKVLEDVPCDELPAVLERLIPYVGSRRNPPGANRPAGRSEGTDPAHHAIA
jgi:precorrin-3B synthase